MLNLFIASILQAFDQAQQRVDIKIKDQDIITFRQVWKKYDPCDSGKIHAIDMLSLLYDLPSSISVVDKNDITENKIFKLFRDAQIPIYAVQMTLEDRPKLMLQY